MRLCSTYGETWWLICTSRNKKLSRSEVLSKDSGSFFKMSFFFRCFSHIFAIANQLPSFCINRLPNVEDFFNINIFCKNINVRTNNNSFKYICVTCYLKLRFYCLTSSAMSNLNAADFTTPNSHHRL